MRREKKTLKEDEKRKKKCDRRALPFSVRVVRVHDARGKSASVRVESRLNGA